MVSTRRMIKILRSPNMYPIIHNGIEMKKKDCSEDFIEMYSCKESLHSCGGVYLGDGMFLYPDGSIGDED